MLFRSQHVSPLLNRSWPEPQWAVDARLLRGQAKLQQGQRNEAASDAQIALAEARRLQDGGPDTARTQAALALLAQASGLAGSAGRR